MLRLSCRKLAVALLAALFVGSGLTEAAPKAPKATGPKIVVVKRIFPKLHKRRHRHHKHKHKHHKHPTTAAAKS